MGLLGYDFVKLVYIYIYICVCCEIRLNAETTKTVSNTGHQLVQ